MNDPEQALAYAAADFAAAHQRYVDLFGQLYPFRPARGTVLDLGCGTGDVLLRFARFLPGWRFVGVDGSAAMLRHARRALKRENSVADRVQLICGCLPRAKWPRQRYDLILSSSFLHHLHEPQVLWSIVQKHAGPGSIVFVPDLRRPANAVAAQRIVTKYSGGEPAILRRDFYNSLRAAFTPAEVRRQLREAGLGQLCVQRISDRHLLVHGVVSQRPAG